MNAPISSRIARCCGLALLVLCPAELRASGFIVFTNLYAFTNGTDGQAPAAALTQGADGNFYGSTSAGASDNSGVIFKLTSDGTFTILHSFDFDDGANVEAALTAGADGYFYGTTFSGGTNGGLGAIFKVAPNGTFSNLYSFDGTNGEEPQSIVTQGRDGNYYGTAFAGGTNGGYGVVFKITAGGAFTCLHSFKYTDGAYPRAGLTLGPDGLLYGTTSDGGSSHGTLFKITTNGVLTSLYSFSGTDGDNPHDGLALALDGKFYGATYQGGTNGSGAIFRISTNGGFSTLYSFTGGNDGGYPNSILVQAADGKLYGTTSSGGTNGFGALFSITTNGALAVLHSFAMTDGYDPEAGLLLAADGNFYGTTFYGGVPQVGVVYRLTLSNLVKPGVQLLFANGLQTGFAWTAVPGQFYQPQFKNDLHAAMWTNLGPSIMATNPTMTTVDTVTGPHRFYRIAVAP